MKYQLRFTGEFKRSLKRCLKRGFKEELLIFAFYYQIHLEVPNNCCTFATPEPAKPLNDAQMCGSFY